MPNWCANGLRIIATNDEQRNKLKELVEHTKKEEANGLLSFFYPTPKDLIDTVAGYMSGEEGEKLKLQEEANLIKHGARNWYDWQIKNWGTKWDVDVQHQWIFDYTDKNIYECFFDSAWSPPISFYNKLVEDGYQVEATYNECGCDYIGWYRDGDDNCFDWGEIKDKYELQFAELQDSPKPTDEDSDEAWEWDTMITDFSQERFFDDEGFGDLTPNGWGG